MAAVDISPEDLSSFHTAHFSTSSSNHFSQHFLGPVEEECQNDAEENDLGHHPDGAKRTLTDEQIAIFRHSEIETLLRERRHAKETRENNGDGDSTPELAAEEEKIEEGEIDDSPTVDSPIIDTPTLPPSSNKQKGKKKEKEKEKEEKMQQAKERGFFKQNVKPDLRKRTWDKVETGLGKLDYDEDSAVSAAPSRPAQRRRISYDDD